jgi:hypothetical protein
MNIILALFAIFALFELIAAIRCPKWLVAFAFFSTNTTDPFSFVTSAAQRKT